ncbi:MAG: hypothetical protein PVH61_02095 [Candidatus Aminicenantes bacterium]|jgi:hypothetical protein
MKKFSIGLLLLVMGFFPRILLSGNFEIAKVGEWGTGRYRDVFIRGNYAYCAADLAGLDIIDISSPYQPRKVGNIDTPGFAIDVHVKGNYAYVADFHEDKGGLLVIDISSPCCPIRVGTYKCKYLWSVFVRGKYAYLLDGNLKIINISRPSSPILTADYDYESPRYGDYFAAVDVYVKGDFAYIAAIEGTCDEDDSTLHVINISDPKAPRIVGEFMNRYSDEHASAVHVRGQYAYLASQQGGLSIIDISKPSDPTEVGYCSSGIYSDVKVRGDYAYLASKRGGLHVIDVSDPASPTLVGKGNNFLGAGVFLSENYAYVASDINGLQVFDVSKPDSPKRMGYYDQSGTMAGLHCRGNYLYLALFYGLRVIDVSNPTSPMLTGNVEFLADYDHLPYHYSRLYFYTTWPREVFFSRDYVYMVDDIKRLYIVDVRNPTSPELVGKYENLWHPGDVYVKGIYAYAAGSYGLHIIDVSNPSSPTLAATYKESKGNYYFESVYVSGNYAYLVSRARRLHVLDMVDPLSPAKVGSLDYSSGYTDNGIVIYVKGKYAYIADKEEGLFIIDVSDPASPKQVGYYDTPGDAYDIRVRGHYAYIADGRKGVQVIDVSDPSSPKRAANYKTPGIGCYALHVKVNGDRIYMVDGEKGKLVALKSFDAKTTPCINTDQTGLCFTAFTGTQNEPNTLSLVIDNSSGGTLNWSLSFQQDWLSCSPAFGTNSGVVSVSVDTSNLAAGSYFDTIRVIDPLAVNSPKTVPVILNVSNRQASPPFGVFATPADNSLVSGGVPFTGWVLDDVGVAGVQLSREEKGSLVYIGDAVLIEGARPDIEEAYPNYPNNSKAGWGYMLLTHFLPNEGNGTFKIHAIAADLEGNQVTLGTKTIICDNANSVKPFGTLDTPTPGGTASGKDFVNFGWALTPPPNSIPIDGSTITVWVDGVSIGKTVYNRYREDIAALFPNYNNSNGAGGYFYLDTTPYENGVHTIQWTVTDDAGNTDGIGSRYFSILDSSQSAERMAHSTEHTAQNAWRKAQRAPGISKIPVDYSQPLPVKRGFNPDLEPQTFYPDKTGQITIEIKELERVEIWLSEGTRGLAPLSNGNKLTNSQWTGFQVIGNQLRSLPIGSFLDTERGVFCWQPGAGFMGKYRFVFIAKDQLGNKTKKMVEITIGPKFPGFDEKNEN